VFGDGKNGGAVEKKEQVTKFGSFFTFENPKAKSQCGCGTSFSI
jgi:hypothetical protein